jgi:hypothetical protein
VGFVFRHVACLDLFLDGPDAKARHVVRVVFAGEKVRPEYTEAAPDVGESEASGPLRVLTLPALVRMKPTSFRIKGKMPLLDLLDVGLIDESWVATLPPELGERSRGLIENSDP